MPRKLLFDMLNRNYFVIRTIPCPLFTNMCVNVYHVCAHAWDVYMQFRVFLVITGIKNDLIILFISCNKV